MAVESVILSRSTRGLSGYSRATHSLGVDRSAVSHAGTEARTAARTEANLSHSACQSNARPADASGARSGQTAARECDRHTPLKCREAPGSRRIPASRSAARKTRRSAGSPHPFVESLRRPKRKTRRKRRVCECLRDSPQHHGPWGQPSIEGCLSLKPPLSVLAANTSAATPPPRTGQEAE